MIGWMLEVFRFVIAVISAISKTQIIYEVYSHVDTPPLP
jgi:hypothetical protein